ncbi:hypothetical protein J6590_093971 [Homalodisca vitripennis]|nr:hypothetical protein J6590_073164 [Homalodisca vitripennis]KAG8314373.1 hypothetical protein J6590_093971 [Homalodisca vitripennis]
MGEFELLDHPLYSPENCARRTKMSSHEEAIVNNYFVEKNAEYLLDGVQRWEHLWEKFVGDYVKETGFFRTFSIVEWYKNSVTLPFEICNLISSSGATWTESFHYQSEKIRKLPVHVAPELIKFSDKKGPVTFCRISNG